MPEAIPDISQLKEVVKERDKEIFGLIKEIDNLVTEFKNAGTEEEKKTGITREIYDKEAELRAVRQKKGQMLSLLLKPTKLW